MPWLLLLLGCSAPQSAADRTPLDDLRARSNAYTSFHIHGEAHDGARAIPLELAWRAPDRALLRYGDEYLVVISGGVARYWDRRNRYALNWSEEIARVRALYASTPLPDPPVPVFRLGGWEGLTVGGGPRVSLTYERLGARLGWLDELRGYRRDGNLYRRGRVEVELREDGFLAEARIGAARFTLRSVTLNEPIADSVFEPGGAEGYADITPKAKAQFARTVEESFLRWVLMGNPDDATLESMIRVDLARRYDPEKMAGILRESLRESLDVWKRLNFGARPEVLKEKLALDRGKTLGSVEIMEEGIQADFETALDHAFRGMAVLPPQAEIQAVAKRWRAAVTRQVDAQIRRRFEQVFDEMTE